MSDNKQQLSQQVGGTHYSKLPYQPVELIAKLNLNWFEGTAIKYITRYNDKGGIEDLRKAKHCIELMLELRVHPSVQDKNPQWKGKFTNEVMEYISQNNLSEAQRFLIYGALGINLGFMSLIDYVIKTESQTQNPTTPCQE